MKSLEILKDLLEQLINDAGIEKLCEHSELRNGTLESLLTVQNDDEHKLIL